MGQNKKERELRDVASSGVVRWGRLLLSQYIVMCGNSSWASNGMLPIYSLYMWTKKHFYFVIVHCVAYSIKQSRTISPILSVCVGEILKAQQDKILNGIWMLVVWNGRSLYWGQERREKKGVPLGQIKIPEKAWSLVVFIMNSYGASFFGLLACAVETINCPSLRLWLNPRVNVGLNEIDYYIYGSVCANLIPFGFFPAPYASAEAGMKSQIHFCSLVSSVQWWNFSAWPERIRPVNLKKNYSGFFHGPVF